MDIAISGIEFTGFDERQMRTAFPYKFAQLVLECKWESNKVKLTSERNLARITKVTDFSFETANETSKVEGHVMVSLKLTNGSNN